MLMNSFCGVCSNAADPRHNVWSGIHTRLSAEIIDRAERVDGLIVAGDWICGTVARPCPKLTIDPRRISQIDLTGSPPLAYTFFRARCRPRGTIQALILNGSEGFSKCFTVRSVGFDPELHEVRFTVAYQGVETVRTTRDYARRTAAKRKRTDAH